MNKEQKEAALIFMRQNEGMDFSRIASLLSARFSLDISAKECQSLYMGAIMGV